MLRDATESDRADLRRAVVELQEAERSFSDTRQPGEEIADAYLEWLASHGAFAGAGLLAEVDGVFAGFVAGWIEDDEAIAETPDSSRHGLITDLCVMPEFRRRGVGQALLEMIEARLAAKGVRRARVYALARNEPARAAYTSAGYSPHEIIFEKRLR